MDFPGDLKIMFEDQKTNLYLTQVETFVTQKTGQVFSVVLDVIRHIV